MINTYKICKAKEYYKLHSNLKWSAIVLALFNPFCKELCICESRKQLTSFMTLLFELCHQDADADMKTGCNRKESFLRCIVDIAADPTTA